MIRYYDTVSQLSCPPPPVAVLEEVFDQHGDDVNSNPFVGPVPPPAS